MTFFENEIEKRINILLTRNINETFKTNIHKNDKKKKVIEYFKQLF